MAITSQFDDKFSRHFQEIQGNIFALQSLGRYTLSCVVFNGENTWSRGWFGQLTWNRFNAISGHLKQILL
ncbi:hypothetical protein HEQ45_00420 [Lactobacillus sp. ZJLC29-4]|nr:hypothetical protein [Lactobacillus sp. HBUAS51387]